MSKKRVRTIAMILPLVLMSSCAPALIAGSIGGAILAVPATSWLMDPPKDHHLITAIYKSNSLKDAVIHAWNRVRLYENPVDSSEGLEKVLAVSGKLSVWSGAEVQDMIENGKDVIELTVQRGYSPDDTYQVTITLHARTLKNPENWIVAVPPPVVVRNPEKRIISPPPVVVKKPVVKKPVVMDQWIGGPAIDTPPVDSSSPAESGSSPKTETPSVDHWIGGPN